MSQHQEQPGTNSIFVIEDDDAIGALVREVVTHETPYQVVLLTHPAQALQVTKEIKPPLIILSYNVLTANLALPQLS
jgi:DNA-binding response OmpR family regulator